MADTGLEPHRRFCSRSLFTPEELTDNLNGVRNMILQSKIFEEAFAMGVPGGPPAILNELDFVINFDPSGPGRQCLWLSMLAYWPAMQEFVEKNWPGSLSSEHGKEFLTRIDECVMMFLYGNSSDRDLLDQFRDANDLRVAKEQLCGASPSLATVPHSRSVLDVESIPIFAASKKLEEQQQQLESTTGTIEATEERPVLLAEKFRKALEAYRTHWHLQSKVRGATTYEEVEVAFEDLQKTDFIAKIFTIIIRLSTCQRHRIMGSTSDSGVLLENWNRAQIELAEDDCSAPGDDDDEFDL